MVKTVLTYLLMLVSASTACAPVPPLTDDWGDKISNYDCIEIQNFFVDREDFSTHKMERVAEISEEVIDSIQHMIVGEISRSKVYGSVKKTDNCEGRTLVFGGTVTDFKKGSRAARLLIGLGAGKQKLEVKTYLKDKKTDAILASKKVVDRKWGGLAGGDEAKGLRDFAEKVVRFVKTGK